MIILTSKDISRSWTGREAASDRLMEARIDEVRHFIDLWNDAFFIRRGLLLEFHSYETLDCLPTAPSASVVLSTPEPEPAAGSIALDSGLGQGEAPIARNIDAPVVHTHYEVRLVRIPQPGSRGPLELTSKTGTGKEGSTASLRLRPTYTGDA